MLARVSSIESFRQWREDEASSPQDLVDRILHFDATPPMLAGTAFHHFLEHAVPGTEYSTVEALGHTFHLPDCDFVLPRVRELRAFLRYGLLQVTGQVDGLEGRRVDDHKTTSRLDLERYLEGDQWRFYLDLFGADVFRWNAFEIRQVGPCEYDVLPPQLLEQHRYPGLHKDCARLAADFHEFAAQFMPELHQLPEAA